jgi:hypothetical protein
MPRKKADTPATPTQPKRARRRAPRNVSTESWGSLLLACASIVGFDAAIALITETRDKTLRMISDGRP